MSTYVYLQCLDHDPPLRAEEESGQHLYDLPRIRAEVADRARIADAYARTPSYGGERGPEDVDAYVDAYFRTNSARFLGVHRPCRIGIVDETGIEHPLTDGATP